MKTKLFEVRDAMTFVPVMATKLAAGNQSEEYLLLRAGYRSCEERVVVTKLGTLESHDHPDLWTDSMMRTIHSHLEESFDELGFGVVLDAQYLRGETQQPRNSERGTPLEILEGGPEWGMTLKEFADGMQEVQESQNFLEQFRAAKFENVNSMVKFLYNLRADPSWVAAVMNMDTQYKLTAEEVLTLLD